VFKFPAAVLRTVVALDAALLILVVASLSAEVAEPGRSVSDEAGRFENEARGRLESTEVGSGRLLSADVALEASLSSDVMYESNLPTIA
jgi:hypothetical protein